MYYKIVVDGYIAVIGTGKGGEEISAEEYSEILALIKSKPEAEAGYDYKLKEDLTWELVEAPTIDPTEDEISGDEFLAMVEEVL